MSVDELVSPDQLRGLSYETASLYGMPHIGCKYTSENINATAFDADDYRRCACCGKSGVPHNRHHEPPRSKGTFLLETPMGKFVLLPALIDLCGSGTTGCHGQRHRNNLKIRWKWDSPEFERKWWNGYFLSRSWHKPNGSWLWDYGCYIFEHDGRVWAYRGRP